MEKAIDYPDPGICLLWVRYLQQEKEYPLLAHLDIQVPIQLKHTVQMIITGADKLNMHYHLIFNNQVLDTMLACFCASAKDVRRMCLLPAF